MRLVPLEDISHHGLSVKGAATGRYEMFYADVQRILEGTQTQNMHTLVTLLRQHNGTKGFPNTQIRIFRSKIQKALDDMQKSEQVGVLVEDGGDIRIIRAHHESSLEEVNYMVLSEIFL